MRAQAWVQVLRAEIVLDVVEAEHLFRQLARRLALAGAGRLQTLADCLRLTELGCCLI